MYHVSIAQTTTFTRSTYLLDGQFYVPYGVTSLTVECWGAGGGGSNGTSNAVGYGGGGGAYATKSISVCQGCTYNYTVGSGSSSDGGPTIFGRSYSLGGVALLTASGGYSGANGPGGGGTYIAGAGITGFLGGNGATGSLGGGGGGSAGTNSNGNSASGNNGGAAVTGGGAGGTAQIGSSQLKWGTNPGGGGAGGNINQTGGLGADGTIRITYINPSNDANLSNLQFSSGSLSPSFDSTVLNYSTINTLLSSVDVTVTRANANADVWFRVNSSNDIDYALISGNTGSLNLAIGINYIDVKVRSQSRSSIKEYRVAVVRGSINANLSNLTISTGTLSPSFDSTIIAYTSSHTSASTATIGLTKAVAGGGYQIWVNNNIVNNSFTNNSVNVSLVNGTNVIDIRVYSESLSTYKDYKITLIRRQIETDLTSLVIRTYSQGFGACSSCYVAQLNANLSPTFEQHVTDYTAYEYSNLAQIQIDITKFDANATIVATGLWQNFNTLTNTSPLTTGNNIFTIEVSKAGYLSKTYTINIIKMPSSASTLNTLNLGSFTVGKGSFSLRKLSTNHIGPAIRVRRGTSLISKDIYFTTAGDLDTATLKSFIGSENGSVTIWYDQSGSRLNAFQNDTTKQPLIAINGIITRVNSKPTISFNNDRLETNLHADAYQTAFTFAICGGVRTNTSNASFFSKANSSANSNAFSASPFEVINSTVYLGNGLNTGNSFALTNGLNSSSGFSQWYFTANHAGSSAFRNGVANGTGSAYAFNDNQGSTIFIGSRYNNNAELNGWVSEIVGIPSVLSASDQLLLENLQASYHGINTNSNNYLDGLTLSSGTLSPAFSPTVTSYTATVTTPSNIITVLPINNSSNTSVSVNGVAVAQGASSGNITLSPGNNTITVLVTAANASTRTYTIVVNYALEFVFGNLANNTSPAFFSLRKLRTAYSGNAIQVRRSSDNTTINIGYTANGDLDTIALKTFVGANNGFVSIWYDQSGNGRNASQATMAAQPQIVNAGAIYRRNGKPTIYFNSTSLATASFIGYSSGYTLAIIAGVQTNTSYPTFGSKYDANFYGPWEFWGQYFANGNQNTQTSYTLTHPISSTSGFSQWSFSASSEGGQAFRNGSVNGSTGAINYADGLNALYIGTRGGDGATSLNGWISEYLTFGSVLSSTDRQIVENNQLNNFQNTNANLSSLTTSIGSLSPTFNSNNLAYILTTKDTSITFTPNLQISDAAIQMRVNNGSYINISNATVSPALSLIAGSNTIDIKVTNSSVEKVYSIVVTRYLNALTTLGLTIPNPSPAAFSLRNLSSEYSGFAIRVRRSNDNTTQDIGFTANGDLDTAALKTFVGANNGFVNIWYDQSGNLKNATQATLATQPQIVNAGVIYRRNGIPTVYFNSTSLATSSYTGYSSGYTLAIVAGVQTNTTYPTFGGKTTAHIAHPWDIWGGNYYIGNGSNFINITLIKSLNASNGFSQWSFAGSSSIATAFRNGLANGWNNIYNYEDGGGALFIGTRGDGGTDLNGWISEYVTIGSVLNTSDRQTIENNQYTYYNFRNANLSALTLSNGNLSPSFSTNITAYTATVTHAFSSITVNPTIEIPGAIIQVRVNGGAYATVASGTASASLNLNVGNNTIDIRVTALDGTTVKTYTATITRSVATLDNLGLNSSNTSPAAFSLRKISSDYLGSAIQVRRSNDNALSNIGFTANGNLDTAALKTFVGANNGFITIWYDQSSNGRNATQATLAAQPQIVNAGAIYRKNNQPTVYFNGTSLTTASFTGYSSGFSLSIVAGVKTNTTYPSFGSKTNGSVAAPWDLYGSSFFFGNGTTFYNVYLTNGLDESSGFSQWSFSGSGSSAFSASASAFRNGVDILDYMAGLFSGIADAGGAIKIGTRADAGNSLDGWISEYITTNSELNSTDRQSVENNQFAYYNFNNANLSSINISNGAISPSFTANTAAYTASVSNATTSITVTPTSEISGATVQVRVNGGSYATVASGAASSTLNLNAGSNTINIKVTSVDGTTVKTYTLTITRAFILDNAGLGASNSSPAAFSLRKLSSDYAGNAIQVRRSSDNTTSDIGFTVNGDFDTTALKTFVGANNGFVSKWYDQSGNGRDATQATLAAQPQIVNAGSVYRRNGKPTIYFNSTSLVTASYTGYSSAFTLEIVAGIQNNTSYSTFGAKTTTGIAGPWEHWHQYFAYGNNVTQSTMTLTNPVTSTSGFSQWSFAANASGAAAFRNGLANGTGGSTTYADGGGALYLGTRGGDGGTTLNGWISEYVTFASVLNTEDRQTIENNQYNYHFKNTLNLVGLTSRINSTAAFSLRRLSSDYAGHAIQVRRSNDNTLSDIGFTSNGNLDTMALKTFVGANNGFVSIWYDQSGNGNNAENSTAASQPSIVSSGIINRIKGLVQPVVTTNSNGQSLSFAVSPSISGSNLTVNAVSYMLNTTGDYGRLVSLTNGTSANDYDNNSYTSAIIRNSNNNQLMTFRNSGTKSVSNISLNTPTIITSSFDGTNNQMFLNGVAGSSVASSGSFGITFGRLFSHANNADLAAGWLGGAWEIIVCPTAFNTTDRQTLENNQLNTYNINNVNLNAINISSGSLSPSFTANNISYTATVSNSITSITVTPTLEISGATSQVRVNGGNYATVESGAASAALSLNIGSNAVDIKVTALDGTTVKTYTLTVTRSVTSLDNAGLSASNPSTAAFSLRKLSSTYTGSAIQVRRSSDNTL